MADPTAPRLFIVMPCYDEQAVLPETAPLFLAQLEAMVAAGKVADDSRILMVDDGSDDATWETIGSLAAADPHFMGIRQSRNRGQQSSLLAGLMEARPYADLVITCDCDGQDDISAMDQMVDRYYEGYQVVYAARKARDTDTWAKRFSAESFYKLLDRFGAKVVYNHADYRLCTREVLDALTEYGEVNLFLRGLFPIVGYESTIVYYERHERMAGESHYPLKKMLGLAFDGITSLSTAPIQFIEGLGLVVALLSLIGVIWAFVAAALGHSVSGWASLVCIVCFMGGVQLISIGVIGEYVGKTYMESKRRPRYIIDKRTYRAELPNRDRDGRD